MQGERECEAICDEGGCMQVCFGALQSKDGGRRRCTSGRESCESEVSMLSGDELYSLAFGWQAFLFGFLGESPLALAPLPSLTSVSAIRVDADHDSTRQRSVRSSSRPSSSRRTPVSALDSRPPAPCCPVDMSCMLVLVTLLQVACSPWPSSFSGSSPVSSQP